MNRQQHTIASASPAMPDMRRAFLDLEEPITKVRRLVKSLDFMIGAFDERELWNTTTRLIGEDELDAFYDVSSLAREAVIALEDDWHERHGALATYEHHRSSRGLKSPDPLLALVHAYEAGLATYNATPEVSDEENKRLVEITWKPPHDALTGSAVPRPTTMEGAVAALRMLVREFDHFGGDGKMARAVVPAVLAFFDPPPALTVPEAIERHRAAFEALSPLYVAESEATEGSREALAAGEAREAEAKAALLHARPADLADEAARLDHLFGRTGPWHVSAPDSADVAALVASLAPQPASIEGAIAEMRSSRPLVAATSRDLPSDREDANRRLAAAIMHAYRERNSSEGDRGAP